MQTIDTILSFYENNFPIRFGVLLYSSKFVKQTESGDGGLTKSEADTSSLVTYFYFILSFSGFSMQFVIYCPWLKLKYFVGLKN